MTRWTKRTCKTNEINVHYLRTCGDKPPLVLLHGLMLSGACWTPLARTLEKDYDVIMPDARGHGNSSAPNEGYDYHRLATDVVHLIDALGLDALMLLGHSMGGMTAALVANMQPQRLRGLILADPTFLTPERQREVHASDVAKQHRQILNQSKENYLLEARIRHSHRTQEIIELFAEARFQTSMHAFEILTPPTPCYTELISNLIVPTQLIIGDNGSVVSAEMAAELTKLNQHVQVTSIAGAGHAVPYDKPEQFAAIVQGFLQKGFAKNL